MRTLASSPLPANAIQLQYGPCSCYAPTPPPLLYIFPSCPPPSPGLFRLESQRIEPYLYQNTMHGCGEADHSSCQLQHDRNVAYLIAPSKFLHSTIQCQVTRISFALTTSGHKVTLICLLLSLILP